MTILPLFPIADGIGPDAETRGWIFHPAAGTGGRIAVV